jgi:O-antigen/teichoic acid export membrane protein
MGLAANPPASVDSRRRVAQASSSTIDKGGAVSIGVASLLSAASGYVALLLAARLLDVADNAIFLAYWSFMFFWFGILSGVSIETTRAVYVGRTAPDGPRVLGVGISFGAILGVLLLITSFWWSPALFGDQYGALGIVLSIAVVLYAGHATLIGALGGLTAWGSQALVIGADAVVRVALVAVSAIAFVSISGFAVGASLAVLTWVIMSILFPSVRAGWGARADVPLRTFSINIGHAVLAAAASAALVVGFPVLVRIASTDTVYLSSAPLLLAVSLTRAPLLIPLNAYQGVAVTYFLRNRSRGLRPLIPLSAVVLGLGVVGAALAWLIGPWLMAVLIRSSYALSGGVLAGLTFAAALLALLTLTGALTLALGKHGWYSFGWVLATLCSLAILFLPLPIEMRAILSLTVGPVVGVVVHLVALGPRATRSAPVEELA